MYYVCYLLNGEKHKECCGKWWNSKENRLNEEVARYAWRLLVAYLSHSAWLEFEKC